MSVKQTFLYLNTWKLLFHLLQNISKTFNNKFHCHNITITNVPHSNEETLNIKKKHQHRHIKIVNLSTCCTQVYTQVFIFKYIHNYIHVRTHTIGTRVMFTGQNTLLNMYSKLSTICQPYVNQTVNHMVHNT